MPSKLLSIISLIGVGIVGRLIPHIPNATPITAVTLTASKYVGRLSAILIPIITMLITDAIIGFYDWRILVSVYASFMLISLIGIIAQKYPKLLPMGFVLISASLLFFLVSNFSVWLFSPWYEKSISGLMYCYTLGLPFLRNMLLGDISYALALFGAFEGIKILRTRKHITLKSAWEFTPTKY
ncbi:hypothetical protein EPO14_01870 [Patescibacteria group bacterium]|nr:MAG: hypothetical protein EPO14_01870 [Patescibacteria group bacterium]